MQVLKKTHVINQLRDIFNANLMVSRQLSERKKAKVNAQMKKSDYKILGFDKSAITIR